MVLRVISGKPGGDPFREMLQEMLVVEEDRRLRVYDDATGREIGPGTTLQGHPTIGVGRALDVKGLTEAETDFLLANDIASVESAMLRNFPWAADLSESRRVVLAGMIFQLGISGTSQFRNFLAALRNGQWQAAASEMKASRWYTQTPQRVARMMEMMRSSVGYEHVKGRNLT